MHSYPSSQILPQKGKELSFLPLKCTTSLPYKSFPTWGRHQTVLPRNTKLWGRIKLSPPPPMHSYPSPQILLHMGKESSFLPLAMQSYPSLQILPHMGKSPAFFRQNAKLSFPTNPSHSIYREGFFPIMQNFYKSFPTNLLFLFFFIFHFIFIYLFIFYFILLFFSYFLKFLFNFLYFFCKTWNSSPKGKIIPQCLGQIIEEQMPLGQKPINLTPFHCILLLWPKINDLFLRGVCLICHT